ncbi:MAG: hypothetical protein K0S11_1465, partial [Gammaproteobacteria bacterium]|nr:hypothetical protein [Gammaproteobacteria bacterium]
IASSQALPVKPQSDLNQPGHRIIGDYDNGIQH